MNVIPTISIWCFFSSAILSRTLMKFKVQILPVMPRRRVIHYPTTVCRNRRNFLDCDIMHISFRGKKLSRGFIELFISCASGDLLISFSAYLYITVLIPLYLDAIETGKHVLVTLFIETVLDHYTPLSPFHTPFCSFVLLHSSCFCLFQLVGTFEHFILLSLLISAWLSFHFINECITPVYGSFLALYSCNVKKMI